MATPVIGNLTTQRFERCTGRITGNYLTARIYIGLEVRESTNLNWILVMQLSFTRGLLMQGKIACGYL